MLRVATEVAKRIGFMWSFVMRACASCRRAQVKQNLEACKRARRLGYAEVLDSYVH